MVDPAVVLATEPQVERRDAEVEGVREVRRATGGAVPINACGGIATAAEALACLDAGATTVQVYTGLVYQGPRIVRDIAVGLLNELAASPAGVSSLVGAA